LITIVIFALGINLFLGAVVLWLEEKLTKYIVARLTQSGMDADKSTSIVDKIVPSFYIILSVVLGILPSWYTPKPDYKGPFSYLWIIFFLPSTSAIPGIYSIYPPFVWLCPTIWGVGVGRSVTRLKLSAPKQGLLNWV
jgi:hypothetical protein